MIIVLNGMWMIEISVLQQRQAGLFNFVERRCGRDAGENVILFVIICYNICILRINKLIWKHSQ